MGRVRVDRCVLVARDARDEPDTYARILRASGYQAIETASFRAAYQIATTTRLAIIVSDVRLDGSISGLELTRRLRSDGRTSSVPIIVLTNVSRPQDGPIALKAGANAVLEKPVSSPVLTAEIVRLLARRGHCGRARRCPRCEAALAYRDRRPVLAAQPVGRANGDGRERLRYVAGWFCTDPSCEYYEAS